MTRPVARVAVIGTGVIGTSWVTHFLARGLDVLAYDPSPGAPDRTRREVSAQLSSLPPDLLAEGASLERLVFSHTAAGAVVDADFVQECGPEREDQKAHLLVDLDQAAPADVVIASSSSGLLPTAIARHCPQHPERVLVGHPFNPPHLVPLVEVVPGEETSEDAVLQAVAFYLAVGKRPVRVRRELPGHIANRLQAALWREAYSLVAQGAASVEDIDTAIAHGPGLRWALLGPFANQHLSGGDGGIAHTLAHLGPPMQSWWDDLGSPQLTPALVDAVVAQVTDSLSGVDASALAQQRDTALLELLAVKASTGLA